MDSAGQAVALFERVLRKRITSRSRGDRFPRTILFIGSILPGRPAASNRGPFTVASTLASEHVFWWTPTNGQTVILTCTPDRITTFRADDVSIDTDRLKRDLEGPWLVRPCCMAGKVGLINSMHM